MKKRRQRTRRNTRVGMRKRRTKKRRQKTRRNRRVWRRKRKMRRKRRSRTAARRRDSFDSRHPVSHKATSGQGRIKTRQPQNTSRGKRSTTFPPRRVASASTTASIGGGSTALDRKPAMGPRRSSLMDSASSWSGVRKISGVVCCSSLRNPSKTNVTSFYRLNALSLSALWCLTIFLKCL